jgi:hypothetical protein
MVLVKGAVLDERRGGAEAVLQGTHGESLGPIPGIYDLNERNPSLTRKNGLLVTEGFVWRVNGVDKKGLYVLWAYAIPIPYWSCSTFIIKISYL